MVRTPEREQAAVQTREARDDHLRRLLDQTDEHLSRLKVEWEKYFLGVEKRPPDNEMRRAEAMFREITKNRSLKTALKFKTQVVKDRWISLKLYWNRNLRMVEEGTHPRQRRMMTLREKQQALEDRLRSVPDKAAEPAAAAAQAPSQRAPSGRGAGARNADSPELFKDFILARAKCGQKVQGITPDKLAAKLRAQADSIRARTGASNVRFKVVIEDGQPKVKAITS
jgi:hypothetical protein